MTAGAAIVDTNVVVAGLLTGDESSPTARILDGMIRGQFPFVLSRALLAEYRTVLLRPRIRRLHRLTATQVDDLLTAIVANAMVREPDAAPEDAPDPGDQHLWDLLEEVPGATLVTGDIALREHAPEEATVLLARDWIESG